MRDLRLGHQQRDEVRPAVAIDHRLGDLGLQRQHPLDPLRRDIVALVVDDQVLLAVGDDDPALVVEMADVAGREPAVTKHPRRFFGVAPIAVHHILAADHDLAILGDPHLGILRWRPDRLQPDARAWPIAADQRPGLGLAIALEEGDPERLRRRCRPRD